MERKISVNTDKVTIVKGSNWNSITSIDFGGTNVYFSGNDTSTHPFSGNTTITSITNANITNSCDNLFSDSSNLQSFEGAISNEFSRRLFLNCISLKSFKGNCPNVGYVESMFQNCSNLTYVNLGKFYNNSRLANHLGNMFVGCNNLQYVEMIVPSSKSGAMQSWFSIPTTAPCNQYRYVAEVPQESNVVKVVFTSAKKVGFEGYQIQFGEGANRFSAITQTIDGLELYWNEDWDGSDLTPTANNVEIILGTLAEMNDNGKPITLTNDSNFDIVVHFNYYSAEGISVPSKTSKVVTATIGKDAESPSRFNGNYGVLNVTE